MAKYMHKPIYVEATQWFKNGDHPDDIQERFLDDDSFGELRKEGYIVRYFRDPNIDGQSVCPVCGHIMHNHGWLDVYRGVAVCPGDYIVINSRGVLAAVSPVIFQNTYTPV